MSSIVSTDTTCVVSANVMINVVVAMLSMVLLLLTVMLELSTEATIDADEKIMFLPWIWDIPAFRLDLSFLSYASACY